jgi:predicted metal-binding membrane protein
MDMGPGTELGGLGWFSTLWTTMMAAMMLPSLVPMALAHRRTSRRAGAAAPAAGSLIFAWGYLVTWIGAGVAAYALLDGARSLNVPWLAWHRGGPYVAGAVILAAGLYELTPAKSQCLRHCRDPELLGRRWRPGLGGALQVGLVHGGFCVGSSWALMAALFALGFMNVTWMVVLAALVAIEKLLPRVDVAVGTTAAFIAAVGLAVALAPDQVPWLTLPG